MNISLELENKKWVVAKRKNRILHMFQQEEFKKNPFQVLVGWLQCILNTHIMGINQITEGTRL